MRRTAVETASPPINSTARRRRPRHAARRFSDDFRISASHEGGTIMKQTLIRGSAVPALAGTWPAAGADGNGINSAVDGGDSQLDRLLCRRSFRLHTS